MKTTHTPGPWTAVEEYSNIFGELAIGVLGNPRTPGEKAEAICVISLIPNSDDTDRANARLIAAAPELLAALKDAVEPMEALIRHFAGSLLEHKFNALRFVVRDIKQAIAKAEGGQP